MEEKINIIGGNREARADISSYIIHDDTGDYLQIYGSIVHEEVLPKAETKSLQLYDSIFNPPKTISFSPRLWETDETFKYLEINRTKYYEKLINDLSYIFYNLSQESGILVNCYHKNKKKQIQLKDENSYFKVKTMLYSESNSYYDTNYNRKKNTKEHKFITILLCNKENKVNVYDGTKDIELFLCSFGVSLDENNNAMFSLPDKLNNTQNSVNTFELDISEKYKILELLQLLTKSNYNFNGDARSEGTGGFVKNDDQFSNFVNDILKNYKTKDLFSSLTEYGRKIKKKKNTYKFASFLKDEYNGFLPNFARRNRISTSEYIERNIVKITKKLKNIDQERSNVSYASHTISSDLLSHGSNNFEGDLLLEPMSISPHSVHYSDSSSSDHSEDFFNSVGSSDQNYYSKRLPFTEKNESSKQSLEKLYYELKEQLNQEFLNLDSRLYSNYLELAGSAAGGKSSRKKSKKSNKGNRNNKRKKSNIRKSNKKRTKRMKRTKR
jgi:hypothetical protein